MSRSSTHSMVMSTTQYGSCCHCRIYQTCTSRAPSATSGGTMRTLPSTSSANTSRKHGSPVSSGRRQHGACSGPRSAQTMMWKGGTGRSTTEPVVGSCSCTSSCRCCSVKPACCRCKPNWSVKRSSSDECAYSFHHFHISNLFRLNSYVNNFLLV